MQAKTNDFWVFVETNEDGAAKKVGIELLNPGKTLAQKQGGKLVAVILGEHTDAAVEEAAAHGADEILVVDAPELHQYTTDAYTNALYALIEKYGPASMMIGATNNGRDLGPRLACRLKTGLVADCTALDVDEESGNVAWTRPASAATSWRRSSARIIGPSSAQSVPACSKRVSRPRRTRRSSARISAFPPPISAHRCLVSRPI